MKNRNTNLRVRSAICLALCLALSATAVWAQKSSVKTNTRILYHNGPVMQGTSDVYFIWYGGWTEPGSVQARGILIDAVVGVSSSDYFKINSAYSNGNGVPPNGALIYGGETVDSYSRGMTLATSDMHAIVANAVTVGALPLDSAGIYVVVSSADVSDTHPDSTTFCTPGKPPHHGHFDYSGTEVKYIFIGHPSRCPSSTAAQFVAPDGNMLPSPNDNWPADAMASTLAAALSATVTNPLGNGWFDKFGLENSTKCQGTFGQTYLTENNARANMRFGVRDYLIQQNWVNDRKGHCGLSYR